MTRTAITYAVASPGGEYDVLADEMERLVVVYTSRGAVFAGFQVLRDDDGDLVAFLRFDGVSEDDGDE